MTHISDIPALDLDGRPVAQVNDRLHPVHWRLRYPAPPGGRRVLDHPDLYQYEDRYVDFQAALRRLEPELRLGFCRRDGLWCVWRTALHKAEVSLDGLPGYCHRDLLSYVVRVPVVVKYLAEEVAPDEFVATAPDERFLADIRYDLERGRLLPGSSRWAELELEQKTEERRLAAEERQVKMTREIVADHARTWDPTDPTKSKPFSGWRPTGMRVGAQ